MQIKTSGSPSEALGMPDRTVYHLTHMRLLKAVLGTMWGKVPSVAVLAQGGETGILWH